MDLKLNYISKDRYYSNDYIYFLKHQISFFESRYAGIAFAIMNISPYPEDYLVGYNEIKNHHSEVLSETLGEDGWKFLDCYRIVNGEKMYEPIIAAFDENGIEHYFTYTKVYDRDPKTQAELDTYKYLYVPTSLEEMCEKLKSGLMVPNLYPYYPRLSDETVRISQGRSALYGYDLRDYY